jgi:hypothetical protein
VKPTNKPPDTTLTAEQLLERFVKASELGWPAQHDPKYNQ